MKNIFLLVFSAVIFLSACSTAYKSGQTPDDLYFSPKQAVKAKVDRSEENREIDPEERQIRMQAYDPRWRNLDEDYDYDYRYSPYSYGYNYGYYYNPYYYHSPVYFTNVCITNPKNNSPRMTNLGSYNNTSIQVASTKPGMITRVTNYRQYNNRNNNSDRRQIYTAPTNTNDNTRSYSPGNSGSGRTYSPSSSSSGSSSGSSVPRNSRGQ